jgi:hypothetical protein
MGPLVLRSRGAGPALLALRAAQLLAAAAFGSYSTFAAAAGGKVTLIANQDVPPVASPETGTETVTLGANRGPNRPFTNASIDGTVTEVHERPVGKNAPGFAARTRNCEDCSAPANAELAEANTGSFRPISLHISVHKAVRADGGIQGLLRPGARPCSIPLSERR